MKTSDNIDKSPIAVIAISSWKVTQCEQQPVSADQISVYPTLEISSAQSCHPLVVGIRFFIFTADKIHFPNNCHYQSFDLDSYRQQLRSRSLHHSTTSKPGPHHEFHLADVLQARDQESTGVQRNDDHQRINEVYIHHACLLRIQQIQQVFILYVVIILLY